MARLSIKWSEIRLIILSANLMTTPFIRCFINQKETLPEYLEEFSEEFSEEELHEEEQHEEEEQQEED